LHFKVAKQKFFGFDHIVIYMIVKAGHAMLLWVKKQNFNKIRILVSSEIPLCRVSISPLPPVRILIQGGRQVIHQVVTMYLFVLVFCSQNEKKKSPILVKYMLLRVQVMMTHNSTCCLMWI
jgi:hypothetical protein